MHGWMFKNYHTNKYIANEARKEYATVDNCYLPNREKKILLKRKFQMEIKTTFYNNKLFVIGQKGNEFRKNTFKKLCTVLLIIIATP